MVQKTIRFYPEYSDDVEALKNLNEYRKYGFHNSREMMITAINAYAKSRDHPAPLSEADIKALAQELSRHMSGTIATTSNKQEGNENGENNQNDNYIDALNFINTL